MAYRVSQGINTVDYYIDLIKAEPGWDHEARADYEHELAAWFINAIALNQIDNPPKVAQYIRHRLAEVN